MKRLAVSKVRELSFGRHFKRSFDNLESNFSVIYGENESGKSTLAEFLTWAIGGPWRTFAQNSDIFRTQSGELVYGNVAATLNSDLLELDARFKLKSRGLPDDLRTGHFGALKQDAAAIKTLLGGIAAEDYHLIYHLYGGTLGDIGSGADFSDLFSSFAMGSTDSLVSPRQALEQLESKSKKLESARKDEKKRLKEIEEQIKLATRAPEEIEQLKAAIEELSLLINQHGAEAESLVVERDLLTRLISGQSHLSEKRLAESEIQLLPTASQAMQIVAENMLDLQRVTENKKAAEIDAHNARQIAEKSILTCGLSESSIKDRTFTPIERVEVVGVARLLLDAMTRRDNAESAVQVAEQARNDKDLEITRQCSLIGLSNEHLIQLDVISGGLAPLAERAGRWVEQVNFEIEAEAKLAALKKVPNVEGGPQGRPELPRIRLAAGFVLVALAGFMHPIAGLSVAIGLAAIAMLFRRRKTKSKLITGITPDTASAETSVARDIETHRKQAESHRRMLLEGLGPLADLIDGPDTSRAKVNSLITIAELRRQLGNLSTNLRVAHSELADADSAKVTAEQNAKNVLGVRHIPLTLVDQHFETWLAKYELAVGVLTASGSAQRNVDGVQEKISALLAPISGEIAGLELTAVVERVRQAHEVEEQRKAALQRKRNAELAISAANLDSPEAVSLLKTYDHNESRLRGRLEMVTSEASAATVERDRKVAQRAEQEAELRRRSGVEILPGLNLARGQQEEKIDEQETQFAAVTVALKVLRETIDRYERENQAPVVKTASELINKVVPDWGTVVFTRDDRGNPILERADNDGRLTDKALSDGARALLYLGIRLAFAQKDAEKRGIALPLICDDPLIHFDDQRSLSALQLLAEFSNTHQVVLFTCETRTRDAAAKIGATVIKI